MDVTEVERFYLRHAMAFPARFCPHSYLRLLGAWQDFVAPTLTPAQGEQAWLVVGIDSDRCFPLAEQALLVDTLRTAGVSVAAEQVSSLRGHDSFLVEPELYRRALTAFLAPGETPSTSGETSRG